MCDSRSDRHSVNRWWSDEDCAVSAYSENLAVWGEVRLGRREVGANTYTAVVVVDSVVWRGCFLRCLRANVAGQRSRGLATVRAGLRRLCSAVASDGHWVGRVCLMDLRWAKV